VHRLAQSANLLRRGTFHAPAFGRVVNAEGHV
jgi:hypothetical protein